VNELVIEIDCNVIDVDIADCLDLRSPEAREWMIDFYRHPPEGIYGEAVKALAAAHEVRLDTINSWADLLPVVNARSFGGNPLTDIFGAFLQQIGCKGLVYPSARSDYMAKFQDGKLEEFFGWNFVDYRQANLSGKVAIDIGNPIEALKGENAIYERTTGPLKGSIAFYGNTMFNRIMCEQQFLGRTTLDSSEWRLKNGKKDIYIRGYMWFKRRYSIVEENLDVICASCGKSFPAEEVFLDPICPNCNYPGDV
jgi:hypothetical protein